MTSVTLLMVTGCGPRQDEAVSPTERFVTTSSGFSDESVASNLASPTAMTFAPDGRLFVCEQSGKLRVIKNGALLASPFLTVPTNADGERGLLGVAFHPNFATNGFVFVYYTSSTPALHNRVSRFTANGDVAVSGSEVVIMDLDGLSGATNHNGGALHFGQDGLLYVAVGENANSANAQTLANRLGKVLRINADGTIPTNNPFYGTATGANRSIWALGLRNPFTFAFHPISGRMFINDVGQDTWEEINDGVAGSNYGWPTTEGTTTNSSFRSPIFAYGHGTTATTGCAVTGGAFYNPPTSQYPSTYVGKYFFADYCGNWIRLLDPTTGTAVGFVSGIAAPVDLAVGSDGLLYYLARGASSTSGIVGRIRYTGNQSQAPVIGTQPQSQTVSAGQVVTFNVAASGTAPLTYQWQRNGANISGATGTSYSFTAATTDNGTSFAVIVTNSVGSTKSNSATLTVTTNMAPTATIIAPMAGLTYAGGDTVTYSGTGTDPEDGTLPASAFTWQVDFHHDTHLHPAVAPVSGSKSGSFVIPKMGETSANVYYRVLLTVVDSKGASATQFVDVRPRTSTIGIASNPSGLQLLLDGQPVVTPYSVLGVVGMTRQLSAPSPQASGGTSLTFSSWSDGQPNTHTFDTPAASTTYTAIYRASGASTGYQQDPGPDGLLVFEAEHFDSRVSQSSHDWTTTSSADASGSVALFAGPNNGAFIDTGYVTTSPRADFRVNFVKTGVHYLWVRGRADSGSDDSFHMGIDGQAVTSADRMTVHAESTFSWSRVTMDGPVASVPVASAGVHMINLWMREDGTIIDKILLTSSANFTPTGYGPPESPTN